MKQVKGLVTYITPAAEDAAADALTSVVLVNMAVVALRVAAATFNITFDIQADAIFKRE